MRIVAIGSMPLDLELTCFGTLSISVKNGHDVYLIVARDEAWTDTYIKAIIESSKIISISKVYFTDRFDYSAITQDNASIINSFIKTINPSLVIMPFWKGSNYKRKILAKTSLIACRGIGNILMYELDKNPSFLPNIQFVISANEIYEKLMCLNIYGTLDKQEINRNANNFILDPLTMKTYQLHILSQAYNIASEQIIFDNNNAITKMPDYNDHHSLSVADNGSLGNF